MHARSPADGQEMIVHTCIGLVLSLVSPAATALAAPPAPADDPRPLTVEQLREMEQAWARKRAAMTAYHITQRSRHPHRRDSTWREDTFIRYGNALYQSHFNEARPEQITESLLLEQDGDIVSLSELGVRVQNYLTMDGRGLGQVFVSNSADRVDVLAAPPQTAEWVLVVHSGGATERYTVDPSTGLVLEREARDAEGNVTYMVTRSATPLQVDVADRTIQTLIARAEAVQEQLLEEAMQAQRQDRFAIWSAYALLVLLLGASCRLLVSRLPANYRFVWAPMAVMMMAFVLIANVALQMITMGYYEVLLVAAADLPVGTLGLPRSTSVYEFLTILMHGLIWGAIALSVMWLVIRCSLFVVARSSHWQVAAGEEQ